MKSFVVAILFYFITNSYVVSQPYDTLNIGYTTSVNLIFDSPVRKWDMGLGVRIEGGEKLWDVLVENPSESPERIKLAAGIEQFETTNLFVETESGYFNFILRYCEQPKVLLKMIKIEEASILKEKILNKGTSFDPSDPVKTSINSPSPLQYVSDGQAMGDSLGYYCETIQKFENDLSSIGKSSQKILFFLGGIYISGDHLFFKLYIKNSSNIEYDIGFVGFFKGDRGKRGNKKRPKQDELLTPIYVMNDNDIPVSAGEIISRVYAFEKFTLSKRQSLFIQLWEGEQGERKMELVVRGKNILEAKVI